MVRYIFLITGLLLVLSQKAESQCNADASAEADPAIICGTSGTTTLIGSSVGGNVLDGSWSPAVGLTNPDASVTQAQISFPITYTYTVRSLTNNNVVVNGDFEGGNTGFSSTFIYQTPGPGLLGNGTYTLATTPAVISGNFPPCVDHTSGTGNMLIANGTGAANRQVWCQAIPVNPTSDYIFSVWVGTAASFAPATLTVTVNGQPIGPNFSSSSTNCQWTNFTAEWINPGVSVALVCITNVNSAPIGPFFALDDITFTEICKDTAQVSLDLLNLNALAVPPAPLTCNNTTGFVDGTGSSSGPDISYEWSTQNGNILSGANTIRAEVNQPGRYTLTVIYDDGNGVRCEKEVEVSVIGDPERPEAIIDTPDTLNCSNPLIELDATGSSSGNVFDYQWSTTDGNIVNGGSSLEPTVNRSGTYQLIVRNIIQDCADTSLVQVLGDTTAPVAAISIPDTLTCDNPAVDLFSVNQAVEYIWISPDSFPVVDSLSRRASVTRPGEYQLIVIDASGLCSDTATVRVFANQTAPNIVIEPASRLNCVDTITVVDASQSDTAISITYFWTDIGGELIQDTSLMLVVDSPGFYFLTLIDTLNGCTAFDSMEVEEVISNPEVDAGTGQTFFCSTDSLILNGQVINNTPDLIVQWVTQDGNISSAPNLLNPTITLPGTYYLLGLDTFTSCSFIDSVIIDADTNVPDVNFSTPDMLTCSITSVTIDASSSNPPPNAILQWSTQDGNIISPADQITIDVDQPGNYQLVIEDPATGCINSGSVEVLLDTATVAISINMPDTLNCTLTSVDMLATLGMGNTSSQWTDSTGNPIAPADSLLATVSQPGFYTITVTNLDNGCISKDSVEVLASTIDPVIEAIVNDSLDCMTDSLFVQVMVQGAPMDFSYQWFDSQMQAVGTNNDSLLVFAAGRYFIRVTDINTGCAATDSVDVLRVFDPPILPLLPVLNITCDDDIADIGLITFGNNRNLAFQWSTTNGNISSADTTPIIMVDAAGDYNVLVLDLDNGCTWDTTLVVSIDTSIAPINILQIDTFSCANPNPMVSIDTNGLLPGTTFNIYDVSGSLINTFDTTRFSFNQPGRYFIESVHPQTGCLALDSFTIIDIATPPSFTLIAPDSINCSGMNVPFWVSFQNSLNNYQVDFSGPPGANIQLMGDTALTDLPGTYRATVLDLETGCLDSATVNIVADTAGPEIRFGSLDSITCIKDSVILRLTNYDSNLQTISWSTQSGNIRRQNPDGSITVDQTGTYNVILTDNNSNCSGMATIRVGENMEFPNVSFIEPDTLDCITAMVSIDALNSSSGNIYSYNWATVNGTFVRGTNSLLPSVNAPGWYTLSITNIFNGCTTIDSIEVIEAPNVLSWNQVTADQPNCNQPFGNVTINVNGGNQPLMFSINGGTDFFTSNQFSDLPPGNLDIVVIDNNGCSLDTSLSITIPTDLQVSLLPQITLNLGEEFTLNPVLNLDTGAIASFTWMPASNLSCSDCYRPVLTAAANETITVSVVDTNGCVAMAEIEITLETNYNTFFPNAFSPNGDGINDTFHPFAQGNIVGKVKTLLVFDRWGNLLFQNQNFQANDPDAGWDGRYKGKAMDQNVFVFYAEIEYLDGTIETFKGDLTLYR